MEKISKTYDPCNLSDAQIWDLFRSGDESALSYIYKAHVQGLFRYGLMLSRDDSFVMDCIHDLFEDLIKHHTSIGSTSNIRYYLIRSLRNKMLHHLKHQKHDFFDDNDHFLLEAAFEESVREHEAALYQRRRLREMLQKLPERQKEAIYLRYFLDCNNDEIAKIMDINYQAVRNTLYKAIDFLRKNMKRDDLIIL